MRTAVLVGGGLITAGPLALAVAPQLVTPMVGVPYVPAYATVIQHWGFMVGLLGVMMIVAAFKPALRPAVLLYAGIEKMFMGVLYLQNGEPGFFPVAIVDPLLGVLCLALWVAEARAPEG